MDFDGEALLRRLHARSKVDGDCLVWTGAERGKGYGSIKISGPNRRNLIVHRAAWMARHGEPPAETPLVLHKCDKPRCFKDDHLFLGTHADNVADMVQKGRQNFFGESRPQYRCEDGPGAKLTNVRVSDIKLRLILGQTQQSIADIYGVSKIAICHIWRGRNWVEIPWPEIE